MENKEIELDLLEIEIPIKKEKKERIEQKKYYCEDCDNFFVYKDGHLLTKSHLERLLELGKISEIIYRYNCIKCNYHGNDNTNWITHQESMKHKLSPEEYKQFLSDSGKNKNETGTKLELFMYDSLNKTKEFSYLKHMGSTGNKFDIIYILNEKLDCLMGIQVRKLTENGPNNLIVKVGNYPDMTLMILINQELNIYTVFYYYEIKHSSMFSLSLTKHKNRIYNDIDKFIEVLTYYMYESAIIHIGKDFENKEDFFLTSYQKQENGMKIRLKEWLNEHNIKIEYNTKVNAIDGFITSVNDKKTNIKVQLKSSNNKDNKLYLFNMKRGDDIPYSINDGIDFFIYEIVDKKYQNNFYFIPIKYLIEKGVISTDNVKGKISIRIAPKDYNYVMKKSTRNKSGVLGVSYNEKTRKWTSSICVNKKQISERFNTKEEAIKHRKQIEEKYKDELNHFSLKFLNKYKLLSL
jgi:hypothetical protein